MITQPWLFGSLFLRLNENELLPQGKLTIPVTNHKRLLLTKRFEFWITCICLVLRLFLF